MFFWKQKKRIYKQYNLAIDIDVQFIVIGDSLIDMYCALNVKMKVFILGKFKNKLVKYNNAIIFSTPEKIVDYIKSLVQGVKC